MFEDEVKYLKERLVDETEKNKYYKDLNKILVDEITRVQKDLNYYKGSLMCANKNIKTISEMYERQIDNYKNDPRLI